MPLTTVPLFLGTGDLYLHTQMLTYYAVAAVLGLIIGYLLWGWGRATEVREAHAAGIRSAEREAEAGGNPSDISRLKTELDICTKARAAAESNIEKIQAELEASRAGQGMAPVSPPTPVDASIEEAPVEGPAEAAIEAPVEGPVEALGEVPDGVLPEPDAEPTNAPADAQPDTIPDLPPEPVEAPPADIPAEEPIAGETAPERLDQARNGAPDDLKRIKGVGPKLEKTLNELGFFHFDQIARWTGAEIAWVDTRLKFKGRIERDAWVAQAKAFAEE